MIPLLRGLTINVREYRRGDQKWTIQNIWQYKIHKQEHNVLYYHDESIMANLRFYNHDENEMKIKRNSIVGTFSKSNRKIVERGKFNITNTQIHDDNTKHNFTIIP
jgi:hypothetical protein